LADAVKKEYDIEPQLIKSRGGVFEVEVDGNLIFSKKEEYRFPENSEIIELLKSQ
jgi:selT/selW/selH-like putative selenoprotein